MKRVEKKKLNYLVLTCDRKFFFLLFLFTPFPTFLSPFLLLSFLAYFPELPFLLFYSSSFLLSYSSRPDLSFLLLPFFVALFLPYFVFPSGFFMPFRPTFFPSHDLFFCQHFLISGIPSASLESHSFWLASPLYLNRSFLLPSHTSSSSDF